MDLIQLMGSPSANRIALGKVGSQGSSETVDTEAGKEFSVQLGANSTKGQEKEVDQTNGLIAQMVALDLLPNQLTVPAVEGDQAVSFDLSFGQIKGDSAEVDGDVVSLGQAADVIGIPGHTRPLSVDVLGQGKDSIPPAISQTLDKISTLVSQAPDSPIKTELLAALKELSLGTQSKEGVADLLATIQKLIAGLQDGAKPGFSGGDVEVGFKDPTDCVFRVDGEDLETRARQRFDNYGFDGEGNVESEQKTILADSTPQTTAFSAETIESLATLSKGLSGIIPPVLKQDDGGTPAICFDGTSQTGEKPKVQPGSNPYGQKVVDPEPSVFVDPREFGQKLTVKDGKIVEAQKSVDLSGSSQPSEASKIIESIAGRLTRESFGFKPIVKADVATASTDSLKIEAGQAETVATVAVVNAEVVASQTEEATGTQAILAKGNLESSKSRDAVLVESGDRLVDYEEDDLDVSDVNADQAGTTSEAKGTEAKAFVGDKSAAERAVKEARQEIVQTVLDFAAARRPQSLKIQMTPFELGTIDISVRSNGGKVDVDLRASDEAVRHSLAAHRGDLVQSIENKGTTVASMNVGQHTGQELGQSDGQAGQQTSREEFRQAAVLGQISRNAETPAVGAASYGTGRSGRVDLAA